ncbi:hypothetical protein BBP07_13975 [Citrobacter koseri]|nr:hypothetical protein BBP07_13975 [Citrobacter koseri]BDG85617.1 hypothetical protein TUM13189_31770 [Citrobacter koseri]BDG90417.1 hypothetical protein TUM20903_31550 [Citrobacter koseri]STB38088.1 Uncharacterised protein [Citrobacter koseri]
MITKSSITLSLIGLVFFCGIVIYILMFIANKNFYTICDLYKKKFGKLPLGTELFYTSSPFFLVGFSMKLDFILWPILYNRKSRYSDNVNDVEFIRSLPKKLTRIYMIHFFFSVITALFFCMLVIMLYIIK